jgi:hypothetical protein
LNSVQTSSSGNGFVQHISYRRSEHLFLKAWIEGRKEPTNKRVSWTIRLKSPLSQNSKYSFPTSPPLGPFGGGSNLAFVPSPRSTNTCLYIFTICFVQHRPSLCTVFSQFSVRR